MISNSINKIKGFTLIEVIISLVAASFLVLMVMQFTYTSSIHGAKSTLLLSEATTLHTAMEKVTAEYRKRIKNNKLDLSSLVVDAGINSELVKSDETGFIQFSGSGNDYTSSLVKKSHFFLVTLAGKDGQCLRSLFAD